MFISNLRHYAIVLGIPWLRLHDVAVRFASNTVTFGSQYCISHCHYAPVTVQGVTEEPPDPVYHAKDIFQTQILPHRPFQWDIMKLNGALFFRMVTPGKLTMSIASLLNVNKAIEAKYLKEHPLKEIVPEQYHDFLPLFS
jgi:hypothetical protein